MVGEVLDHRRLGALRSHDLAKIFVIWDPGRSELIECHVGVFFLL